MNTRWFIGLASGSSLDGVDAALLEVAGAGLDLTARPVHLLHQPHARDLRNLLLRVLGPGPSDIRQVSLLHRLLGETLAATARQVADRASFSLQQVMGIGCLGQCVWQEPDGRFPSALNLGTAALIAERSGVTTLSDFRSRDLAAGGQGAPLEALADQLLFRHPQESRLLIHLGGTATVTCLPAGGRLSEVVAFEAAPCTLLLDGLIRQLTSGREAFDPGGKHAVQGRCLEPLLERWLAHPYWQRRPPRYLGQRACAEELVDQALDLAKQMNWAMHDVLCSATHLVVRGIATALRRFLPTQRAPDLVLLSGGGVRNGLLWHLLEQQLAGTQVARTDTVGIPAESRKAMAAAVLAALTVDGVPANMPALTGAAGTRLLGSLTPGSPANWGRCVAWMAAQASPPLARAS
jgi:anhydro-N-acetylmuramic acid kinase